MQTVKHLNNLVDNGYTPEQAIEELNKEIGIVAGKYLDKGLVVLNYDQINSPKKHPIVIECRGLILGVHPDGFRVISRSFDRFFNLGECEEHRTITALDNHHVFEKVDGSLIRVYFHDGQWQVATRGTAFAESSVNGYPETFRALFLRAVGKYESGFQEAMKNAVYVARHQCGIELQDVSLIFELAARENRVVTPYTEDQLVLIGARYRTGEEFELAGLEMLVELFRSRGIDFKSIRLPQIWDANHLDELHSMVAGLGGLQEGFVVANKDNFARFKVKSAAYLVAHHIRNNGVLTPLRVGELVVTGEHVEYLNYFPEDARFFQKAIETHDALMIDLAAVERSLAHIGSQKDFALQATKYPFSAVLFQARKTKQPALSVYAGLDTVSKVKLLLRAAGLK